MDYERLKFWLSTWGAISGTIALMINYFSFRRARARLSVRAKMSFGGDARFGKDPLHFMTISLTNSGQGIVRIFGIAISLHSYWKYHFLKLINCFRQSHKKFRLSIGIYSGSTDPLDAIFSSPQIKTYPPKNIILEDHETKEICLPFTDQWVSALPFAKGLLIVTTHIGQEHLASFIPIHMVRKASKED